jgi:hypothetical protein
VKRIFLKDISRIIGSLKSLANFSQNSLRKDGWQKGKKGGSMKKLLVLAAALVLAGVFCSSVRAEDAFVQLAQHDGVSPADFAKYSPDCVLAALASKGEKPEIFSRVENIDIDRHPCLLWIRLANGISLRFIYDGRKKKLIDSGEIEYCFFNQPQKYQVWFLARKGGLERFNLDAKIDGGPERFMSRNP